MVCQPGRWLGGWGVIAHFCQETLRVCSCVHDCLTQAATAIEIRNQTCPQVP